MLTRIISAGSKRVAISIVILTISLWLVLDVWMPPADSAKRPAISTGSYATDIRETIALAGQWERQLELKAGQTIEISTAIARPATMPPNGRIAVQWRLVDEKHSEHSNNFSVAGTPRQPEAFGIYSSPTADFRKVLHALDPDIFLAYRAPVSGTYALTVTPVTDETPAFVGPRWRDEGSAPLASSFPANTPWPAGRSVSVSVSVSHVDLESSSGDAMYVEQEPNDSPEMAQPIRLPEGDGVQSGAVVPRRP